MTRHGLATPLSESLMLSVTMSLALATDEFVRRFLLHVLPKGFHRIRHYGLLAGAIARRTSTTPDNCLASRHRPRTTRPKNRPTSARHARAAAGTWSSSKPSNAGASRAHRRTPPQRPGPLRHDPAWLGHTAL